MRWWKPHSLIDDAEKPVAMFDCYSVRGREDWERDPGLADVAERLQMSVAETFNFRKSFTTFEGLLFILWCFSVPLLLNLLSRNGLPPWFNAIVLGLTAGHFLQHLGRRRLRERQEHVINTLLGEGRCASCGYAIASIPADGRGLVTCPECAACWARTGVFAAGATGSTPPGPPPPRAMERFWKPSRELLIDANGRYLRAADFARAARHDEGLRALHHVSMQVTTAERLVKGLGGVVMAIGFGIWGLVAAMRVYGSTLSALWNLIPPAFLLLIAASSGYLASLALRGNTRATSREMAHRLVRIDRCPACLGGLARDPDASATRWCTGCGAHWSLQRETFEA